MASAYFTTAAGARHLFGDDDTACEEFDENNPDADTSGCLEQEGDNEAESDNDFEGTGGDGVAGSNVIGTAGSGDTDITASNDSRFADAEGGNVEAESNTTINNGPELSVEGGNTSVTANATGISTVDQLATPEISITLNQVSTSTGAPVVSNTVTSLTTLTAVNTIGQSFVSPTAGAGFVSPTATGAGPVTQTLTQVGSSTVNNVFAPIVTTTAVNTANVTGSAPVNQTGAAFSSPTATATGGPNTTRAFLSQIGDNEVEADNDFEGTGGDGVAGSNIIGVAGSGDTSIDATNVSEFADGQGGDTEFQSDLVVDNGPDLTVEGGNTSVLADALGISTVDQVAAPVIGLTVSQTATAVGPQEISNSVSSATNITGSNIVDQTAAGASPVSPTGTGASPVSPTGTGAAPIVFIFSPTNTQTIAADGATCTQTATGGAVSGPGAVNDNPQSQNCFTNIFAPVFNFNFSGGVTPTAFNFGGGVTPTATGPLFGPVTQTLNQTGSSTVTNTFAPVINTIASNTANVTGSTPVTQSATAITTPTAIAQAGANTTRGALVHEGDNDFESDVDAAGVGGDGIAGSNVIGVAGSGDTTINASNNSLFADGVGGDTIFEQTTTADNGPTVSIEGGNVDVTAIATGIAEVNQTATPSLTISLDQLANATGPSTVSNTVSSSTTIIGSNVLTQSFSGGVTPTGTSGVTPTFGTTQTLNQTGSSTVDNNFSPTVNTTSTNSSTLSGSSPVNQTATTVSNPTAIAIAP